MYVISIDIRRSSKKMIQFSVPPRHVNICYYSWQIQSNWTTISRVILDSLISLSKTWWEIEILSKSSVVVKRYSKTDWNLLHIAVPISSSWSNKCCKYLSKFRKHCNRTTFPLPRLMGWQHYHRVQQNLQLTAYARFTAFSILSNKNNARTMSTTDDGGRVSTTNDGGWTFSAGATTFDVVDPESEKYFPVFVWSAVFTNAWNAIFCLSPSSGVCVVITSLLPSMDTPNDVNDAFLSLLSIRVAANLAAKFCNLPTVSSGKSDGNGIEVVNNARGSEGPGGLNVYVWVAPSVQRGTPACGGGQPKSGLMIAHDCIEEYVFLMI